MSIRDFTRSDQFRNFSGNLSAGDVGCNWTLMLWQNGFWTVKADFHDGGILGGDFYAVDFLLSTGDPVGVRLEGSILDPLSNRRSSASKEGSDPWIRENWQRFEASGPSVSLHAAPAIGMLVENAFLVLVIVVGAAVTAIEGGQKVKKYARRSAENGDPSTSTVGGNAPAIDVGQTDEVGGTGTG